MVGSVGKMARTAHAAPSAKVFLGRVGVRDDVELNLTILRHMQIIFDVVRPLL